MEIDEYIPIEPNYYNYKGKKILTEKFNNNDIMMYNSVNICAYKVDNKHKYPFLHFLLINNEMNNTLTLPNLLIFKKFTTEELVDYSKFCLFGLTNLPDFEKFNEALEFNGFFEFNNILYLFFDITNCNCKVDDDYSNVIYFPIINEIVNTKKYANLIIDNIVSHLFSFNYELSFLTDKNDNVYEIPIIGYVNKPRESSNFTFIFGETKGDKTSMFGPFFYFTDFNNASKNRGDLIRFALFIGNTKYIENNPNDPIDESEIKKERLQDSNLDKNIEYLTIKISDHDGKWSKKYDSVYLWDVELDNGKYLKNTPIIVVKEYEQQVPLSCHSN